VVGEEEGKEKYLCPRLMRSILLLESCRGTYLHHGYGEVGEEKIGERGQGRNCPVSGGGGDFSAKKEAIWACERLPKTKRNFGINF